MRSFTGLRLDAIDSMPLFFQLDGELRLSSPSLRAVTVVVRPSAPRAYVALTTSRNG